VIFLLGFRFSGRCSWGFISSSIRRGATSQKKGNLCVFLSSPMFRYLKN